MSQRLVTGGLWLSAAPSEPPDPGLSLWAEQLVLYMELISHVIVPLEGVNASHNVPIFTGLKPT